MLAVKIIVNGKIDKEWCEWLGGLAIDHFKADQTMLTGVLPDQSAVYGVITHLRDLGIALSFLSITDLDASPSYEATK
jgi:hypothetical protein